MDFNERYDFARANEDLKFVNSFRNLLPIFNSKEKRLWHKAKWWGCWLRHHRLQRLINLTHYVFCIRNTLDSKSLSAFDYINHKPTDRK